MRRVIFIMLALVMVLISSCIDGEEEVFIEADGSARVKAVYRVPGMLFSAEDAERLKTNIAEEVEKEKHLTLMTNRIDKENGSRIVTIEIETDNMLAIEGALAEHVPGVNRSKADQMLHAIMGDITVSLQGLSADFSREVYLEPLFNEHLGNGGMSILGDSEFRYIVHLPEAVEQSNAHVVEDGGRTLMWSYKLRECAQKPILLQMVAPIPLPWWVYAAGLVILLLLFWAVWKWRVRKPRSSQKGQNGPSRRDGVMTGTNHAP